MGALVVALACACAGCAAVLLAWRLPEMSASLARARSGGASRQAGGRRVREAALGLAELLGHWAPFVRLCNMGPARRLSVRLQPVLAERGVALTRFGCLAVLAMGCLAVALLGALVSGSLLGVPVGVAACTMGIAALIGARERKERAEAAAQMPEVLRSLSAALAAGKSLPQAVAHVGATVSEPLGSEFLRTSFEIEGGRSVEQALDDLCRRIEAPGIELLGTSLQVSQRTGSSLNDLFVRTARMVSSSVALRRELTVKTSQARLSAKVVALMPFVLVGFLTLLSPDYRAGLGSAAGGACLCIAALLDLTALGIVRILMKRSLR